MHECYQHLIEVLGWCAENADAALAAIKSGDTDEVEACLLAILDDCLRNTPTDEQGTQTPRTILEDA